MPGVRQRIIFMHPSDELYGADRMLLEMLASLGNEADVEVWLPSDLAHPPGPMALCNTLTARGYRIRHVNLPILRRAYRSPLGLLRLLGRAGRLFRELRVARPDVVYCTTSAALLGAPVARAAAVPHVIGHFQEIWSHSDSAALRYPARTCHTLLAISEAVAAALPEALRARTTVVPNGTPEPAEVSSLDGRDGTLRFVVASRWNGWKGHGTLLRAWEAAASPGQLVVLGGPPLSGESVDVPALVAELSRPETVSVVGEVTNTSCYIDQADVVLVPSDQPEPFGLVAIEAFAHGRPVVASAAGGLLGIMTPGEDGWVYPAGDFRELGKVLAGLARHDVNRAGQRARETYERRFTTEHFSRTWRAAAFG